MFRLTLENLFARKLRLLSTAAAVMIGVAFLAGTLALTDTIGKTFDDLFREVGAGADGVVRSSESIDSSFGELRGPIDASLLATISNVEGVRVADGDVSGFAQLVRPDGTVLGNPARGAPTLGNSWPTQSELNPMNIVVGAPPLAATDVVLDRQSAETGPFAVGDEITILVQSGPRTFTVSGIATFGSADTMLGATMAMFRVDVAQEVLGTPRTFSSIGVVAEDGVTETELVDRITAVLPPGVEAITGSVFIEENQDAVAEALSFFDTFMLIFALIALFVAAFIIYNTFSILVAQRTKELALLRALGASRRQIVGSVLTEALLVGLVASAVGLGAGVLVAGALKAMLDSLGFDIPAGSIVLKASTAYISIAVGVIVTIVAALAPSRRAASVPPMAALRAVAVDTSGTSVGRLIGGLVVLASGGGLLLWGLLGGPSNAVALVGGGVALSFLGVAALGPLLAEPFSRLVGAPIARLRGVPGELAQENAMRNPKRTSTTAAALMIGVGLVGAITIFAASAKASIAKIIDDSFVGDLVIDSGSFGVGGLSPQLAADLNELPEVEAATGIRVANTEVFGAQQVVFSGDPATVADIVDVGVIAGKIRTMGEDDIALHAEYAADHDVALGDTIDVTFVETGTQTMHVAVIYAENALTGNLFVGHSAYEANVSQPFDFSVYVRRADGVTPDAARLAVERVAGPFANAQVSDLTEFKDQQAAQINQLLTLVYAMLALAIVIALIGIANTLALSILERQRELGLLRAVGMTRSQLRSSVRWESAIIALFGTALGLAVGVFFGWAMVLALSDQGFSELAVPFGQFSIIAVVALIAGVMASVRPAAKAAKLDVLHAIMAG